MTASAAAPSRQRDVGPPLIKIVEYWRENWEATFPDLPAALLGWGEPFCFRCGWLVPMPGNGRTGSWVAASGWLERAHLQDHSGGGSDEAENIVPLCSICHRGMPEFPGSRDDAIAWVKAQDHNCCPAWWQTRTDSIYAGDLYEPFPGRLQFLNLYTRATQETERMQAAVAAARSGDYSAARKSMLLAGISPDAATGLLTRYVNDRASERIGR